jgi:hypothetical protein
MANRVNNWRELLDLANKDLKKFNAELGVYEEDGEFSITLVIGDEETEYASGYYEDELSDLINDAWAHARAKSKSKKTLYLAFPICDEFQRNDLDRKTDDELFDAMHYSQGIIDDVLCYDDVKMLFNDLNNEEIESTNFWLYKIEIDENKFNEWFNN